MPVALYEKVAGAFVMVAREDVAENGETTWGQASGFAVEEEGRHYLYTARHVVFDKKKGDVIALGPIEFEHTADAIGGMSGGPVVDLGGDVVGLCQKGRKTTARKNGIAVESDSRYLRLRNFAARLHDITWQPIEE